MGLIGPTLSVSLLKLLTVNQSACQWEQVYGENRINIQNVERLMHLCRTILS